MTNIRNIKVERGLERVSFFYCEKVQKPIDKISP